MGVPLWMTPSMAGPVLIFPGIKHIPRYLCTPDFGSIQGPSALQRNKKDILCFLKVISSWLPDSFKCQINSQNIKGTFPSHPRRLEAKIQPNIVAALDNPESLLDKISPYLMELVMTRFSFAMFAFGVSLTFRTSAGIAQLRSVFLTLVCTLKTMLSPWGILIQTLFPLKCFFNGV